MQNKHYKNAQSIIDTFNLLPAKMKGNHFNMIHLESILNAHTRFGKIEDFYNDIIKDFQGLPLNLQTGDMFYAITLHYCSL